MISLKDFRVGEPAYLVVNKRGSASEVQEVPVTKIGKKYLYTNRFTSYKVCEWCENALIVNREWGDNEYLFPTEQAARDHVERNELETWLRKITSGYSRTTYSLEQLRAVKRILDGDCIG